MKPKLIRRLEEETTCLWFLACDRQTDMTLDHVILGPVPVCQRCLDTISWRDVAGWRFIITYVEGGETKTEGVFFMSPIRATAEWNVKENFRIWHKRAAILSVEWTESIPPNQGWGDGAWVQAFKKETTPP